MTVMKTSQPAPTSVFARLGPGILFAAAAIGVSHLVQSTRAGAMYGFGLLGLILITCVLKYPSLLFGARYAAATGESLLENYRRQGTWALVLYSVLLLYSMWFILAAVTITTAGIVQTLLHTGLGIGIPTLAAAGIVLACGLALLLAGGYAWLESFSKWLMLALAAALVVVAGLAAGEMYWSTSLFAMPSFDITVVLFVIALAGWMPIPVDASVVTSTWTATRARSLGGRISLRDSNFDFNVGYIGSVVTALCFLILGTAVMHLQGVEPELAAGPFAGQVIALFTSQIGDWSFFLIGVAALLTMFSTVITVLDGSPRQILFIVREHTPIGEARWVYPAILVTFVGGALLVLEFLMTDFGTFIDFVTSLGFLTAPLIVFLNHRAMLGDNVDPEYRPSRLMQWWSIGGGVVITAVSVVYFLLRLTR